MILPAGDFSVHDEAVMKPYLEKLGTGTYLEIGVKHGRSLAFARHNAPKAKIYGVDVEDVLDHEYFKDIDVNFIHQHADEAAKKWKKPIDILFIDGDHSVEQVNHDIENWQQFVKKGGYLFFHDFDITSPGVIMAVDDYCEYRGKILKVFRHSTLGLKTSIVMVKK